MIYTMKVVFILLACNLIVSLALPTDPLPPPAFLGSFVGEVVVDSGSVVVNKIKKKKTSNNEPSFAAFHTGGVKLTSGSNGESDSGKKPPVVINGATLTFNNEAAIAEIPQ